MERSIDGINFNRINSIKADEFRAGNHFYQYEDLLSLTGIYFYRLLILDKSGLVEHSKIVKISFSTAKENSMRISPNPAKDFLLIILPKTSSSANLRIIDSQGQIVRSFVLHANDTELNVDVRKLSVGLYTLLWDSIDERKAQLFFKK